MRRALRYLPLVVGLCALGLAALLLRRPPEAIEASWPTGPAFEATARIGALIETGWVEREAKVEGNGATRVVDFVGESEPRRETVALPTSAAFARNYVLSSGEGSEGRSRREIRRKGALEPSLAEEIDPGTGVAVLRESYRADGRLASRTELRDVRVLSPEGSSSPVSRSPIGTPITRSELQTAVGWSPSEVGWVPDGYEPTGLFRHPGGPDGTYAEQRFSDGLRTLSLFERRQGSHGRGAGQAGHGRGRGRGGPPAAGRPQVTDLGMALSVRQRRGDRVLVLVGDVTRDDALAVLSSIPSEQPDEAGVVR